MVVDLGEDVRMTVLCPNTSEAERQRLPGGGARVSLSWEPEHMHLVRESPAAGPDGEKREDETARSWKRQREDEAMAEREIGMRRAALIGAGGGRRWPLR